jgi:hypothetical protein
MFKNCRGQNLSELWRDLFSNSLTLEELANLQLCSFQVATARFLSDDLCFGSLSPSVHRRAAPGLAAEKWKASSHLPIEA